MYGILATINNLSKPQISTYIAASEILINLIMEITDVKIPQNYMILGVVVVLIAAYLILTNLPGPYDQFAQCLSAKGAKMYGAFWCPHCQDQKEMFGSSVRFVDYVECSTPDEKSETQVCMDANISSYPTWVFSDGSRNIGEMAFGDLSQKTGCPAGS